jgi:hypothetical protein
MASPNAGGFVELTIDGTPYSPVGDVEVEETNFEAEAVTNQDGSISRTKKPKPFKIKLTLRDRQGQSIARALYAAERIDVSAVEKQMKRTVILTGGFATGTPSRNTASGEISGIEICSDRFTIVDGA